MKLFLKVDQNFLANKILAEKLDSFNLKYSLINTNEVLFLENVPEEIYKSLSQQLKEYGFEIIENQKNILVQRMKDLIVETIQKEEALNVKFSSYLADNLGHSYGYLSNLFSEVTYTSIENFIILQKIEVDDLISQMNETFTFYVKNYELLKEVYLNLKEIPKGSKNVFEDLKVTFKERFRENFINNNNVEALALNNSKDSNL